MTCGSSTIPQLNFRGWRKPRRPVRIDEIHNWDLRLRIRRINHTTATLLIWFTDRWNPWTASVWQHTAIETVWGFQPGSLFRGAVLLPTRSVRNLASWRSYYCQVVHTTNRRVVVPRCGITELGWRRICFRHTQRCVHSVHSDSTRPMH